MFDRHLEFVRQLFGSFRNKARRAVAFERLPESFDRVEIGTVRWEMEGLDVMPVKRLGMMPTGVVDHQPDRLALVGNFFGHGIEEGLQSCSWR